MRICAAKPSMMSQGRRLRDRKTSLNIKETEVLLAKRRGPNRPFVYVASWLDSEDRGGERTLNNHYVYLAKCTQQDPSSSQAEGLRQCHF